MAPSTRLRNQPARRIDYAQGSRTDPIRLHDTPSPGPTAAQTNLSAPARKSTRKPATRVKAGAIIKLKTSPKTAVQTPAQPKKKPLPAKRECSVCASTKSVSHSFRLDKSKDACQHFKGICSQCIAKMVAGKIESRQLTEPDLACPYPDCSEVLDHATLRMAFTNKEKFKEYDAALAKHLFTANPSFIACLSSKCGKYFSIQDCSGTTKTSTSQQIVCPYCNYELCLSCNRPWHANTGCSKAAELEDAQSVAQIKNMGAKPCPSCGINIEKQGGCDHMTCYRCRHNFCWQCLVPYTNAVVHLDGCPHGRRDVAVDPGNWAPNNVTDVQVNALIEQARRRLDNPDPQPQADQPGNVLAAPRVDLDQPLGQQQPHAIAFFGGAATLFQNMFGWPNDGA